jgi:hypothetical protein
MGMLEIKSTVSQVLGYMPVILGTWEEEMCRILVQDQPRQKVYKTPLHHHHPVSTNSWEWW